MSKSIKLNDDNYWDSSSIVHDRTPLNKLLSGTLGCRDLGNKKSSDNFDLNDLKAGETCFWNTNYLPTNAPCSGARAYCFKGYGDGYGLIQIVFCYNSTTFYIRYRFGTWSAWRTI